MKIIRGLFLCSVFCLSLTMPGARAQTANAPVEIIKMKWRMTVRNPALEQDSFVPGDNPLSAVGDPTQIMSQNAPRHDNSYGASRNLLTSLPSLRFVYELKIKNTGQKEIRSIIWDYVFFDPKSGVEIGRRHFKSVSKIKIGTTKKLMIRSSAPPTAAINAGLPADKIEDQYSGRIIVRSILFKDGSEWKDSARR